MKEYQNYRELLNEYRRTIDGTIDNGLDPIDSIMIRKVATSLHTEKNEILISVMNMAYEVGFMTAWKKAENGN